MEDPVDKSVWHRDWWGWQ